MEELKFENAYYIKLGAKSCWTEDSIKKRIVRIGWKDISLDDILNEDWDKIKKAIKQDFDTREKRNGSTNDYNALKKFCEATDQDVFITFYKGFLYWCNLDDCPIEEDLTSKFRKTKNGWSRNPLNRSAKAFNSNDISGRISKTQAFQATLCKYSEEETEIICRIINDVPNPKVADIQDKKKEICKIITELIKELHWKDCEILADLIFQQSGWHRVSMPGGSLEFMDMEYLDSINNERYIVQVKSGAKLTVFKEYEQKLIEREFKKLFFVVFHPDESLEKYKNERKDIEILFGYNLSEKIFDLGLLEWVLKKSF